MLKGQSLKYVHQFPLLGAAYSLSLSLSQGDSSAFADGGLQQAGPKSTLAGALLDIACSCDFKPLWHYLDKGAVSNIITLVIMIIGVIGAQATKTHKDGAGSIGWLCVQAVGLFGFSGGVTNWCVVLDFSSLRNHIYIYTPEY